MTSRDIVDRDDNGRWLTPPKSPGRPRGLSRAEKIAQFLEPHVEDTLRKLAELAKLGDPRSAELLLRYVAPPARPDAERIAVPGLSSATTLQAKADCIVAAVANGAVSVEAGEKALGLLEKYVRTVVADDHERRLQAVEQGKAKPVDLSEINNDDGDLA